MILRDVMFMKNPIIFNRPMKKLKEYKNFVLFIDEKLGIRECFQYWDLKHEIIDNKVYEYDNNGKLIPVDSIKNKIPKNTIKTDNRLKNIMERINVK